MSKIKGNVLRIERSSIYDGEGLRTVIFLNGCPLSCKWCSTPESQCINSARVDDLTGGTVQPAYTNMLRGRVMTADEVVREISKDSIFFHHSGGGMTLSGGEMLYQPEFSEAILRGCRSEGINTTCETSLFGPYETVRRLAVLLDSIYADFKIWDSDLHREYVGADNEGIKENFMRLDEEYTGDIHVRIPVVPGINMNEENMAKTAAFFRGFRHVTDIELLPYHRLGMDTYRKLGIGYELSGIEPPGVDDMNRMAEAVLSGDPGRVVKIKGETYRT